MCVVWVCEGQLHYSLTYSETWQKTSSPPPLGVIKPCPLVRLKDFTTPVTTGFSMARAELFSYCCVRARACLCVSTGMRRAEHDDKEKEEEEKEKQTIKSMPDEKVATLALGSTMRGSSAGQARAGQGELTSRPCVCAA